MTKQQIKLKKLQRQIIILQGLIYDCTINAEQEKQLADIIEMLAVKCSEIGEQIYDQRNQD